jgi:hypothetical protein
MNAAICLSPQIITQEGFLLYRDTHNCCKFRKCAVVLNAIEEGGRFAEETKFIFWC